MIRERAGLVAYENSITPSPQAEVGDSCPWSQKEHIEVLVGFAEKSSSETIALVKKYLDNLEPTERSVGADTLLGRALSATASADVQIKHGADHYAELVKELLQYGANPNKFDSNSNYTPFLHFCAHPENFKTMQILIDEGNADVNAADKWDRGGFRLLVSQSFASNPSSIETVNLFLDRGANPTLSCNAELLHVSYGLDIKTITRLIEAGADVNHLKKMPEPPTGYSLKELSLFNISSEERHLSSVLDEFTRPDVQHNPDVIRLLISSGARHYNRSTAVTLKELGIEYDGSALE